ncbi:class I adenylate-forming enzyme family protein [Sulfuricystis thermophila]|uniref:class I adenylate-forming enzyme family protein n=1 Tax=Sulfuricystis thermophila TaxID=2496847 RepID=UPI001035F564|nr:AMP-binding protein [Sulfuricystis thermophila]
MHLFRRWLSRTDPDRPALVLPDGRSFSYGELAGRAGCRGLAVLEGDAATIALGLIDCALGGGTAFPLPPHLSSATRARLIEQAAAAANPRLALIIATSGSTGEPKGVRLTRRSIAAAARISARALDLQPRDAWLCCLPLHFIAGAMTLYRSLRAGATAIVQEGFEVAAVARALAERRITHVSLVPAMLAQLIEGAVPPAPTLRNKAAPGGTPSFPPAPTFGGESAPGGTLSFPPAPTFGGESAPGGTPSFPPAPSLKCALIGGAALSPLLESQARAAGWPIRLSYGMTETCATALVDGRPLPGVRVRLSEAGTLEVATPARMAGYLNEADVGEWIATRDLARIDADGHVTILGRVDDVLNSAGVKVHPLEVEARLAACPGVRAAAVTGLSDPVWGDLIAAAFEGDADEAAVEAWCRAQLPSTRRPRRFLRVARLPRLASGKLDRRALPSLWR